MWQKIVILLVLVGVSIYLVRYFIKIYRGENSICAGCSGCCQNQVAETFEPLPWNVTDKGQRCEDMKKHENQVCH